MQPVEKPIVLIADDEEKVLQAIKDDINAVLGKDYRLEIAQNGQVAVDMLTQFKQQGKVVPLIIADHDMPILAGDETLIQARQIYPGARKIMITGKDTNAQFQAVANAINKAELYRFVAKPWVAEDLRMTVSTALKSFQQEQLVEEQNRLLTSLFLAAQAVAQEPNLNELIGETLHLLLEFTRADRALLLLAEGEGLTLEGELVRGQAPQTRQNIPLAQVQNAPKEVLARMFTQQQPLLVETDVAGQLNFDPYLAGGGIQALAVLPILLQGKSFGLLYVENKSGRPLGSDKAADTLRVLANQTGTAIDNAFLKETFQEQLEARTTELLAALSHKDEMVRIVSHDIRSPLTGIDNLVQLMQGQDVATNPEQVVRFSGIIQKSVQTVLKLVNDILDLAKLQSGAILVTRQTTNLVQVVKQAASANEAQCVTKGLKLTLQTPAELEGQVDGGKLLQALNNIVTNAIKFTNAGGEVTLGLKETTLNGRPAAHLWVKDSGIGIAPEDIPKLFDKFGKAQRSGTKGEKGTGLGLSIVKTLIEMQQGNIRVESAPGQGTTFHIELPLQEP
jgi:signal transduction histidine kinase